MVYIHFIYSKKLNLRNWKAGKYEVVISNECYFDILLNTLIQKIIYKHVKGNHGLAKT